MEWMITEEQASLVADTIKTIAEHRGYTSYPTDLVEIRLVMEATLLVGKAIRLLKESYGTRRCRKDGRAKRTERSTNSPDSHGDKGS